MLSTVIELICSSPIVYKHSLAAHLCQHLLFFWHFSNCKPPWHMFTYVTNLHIPHMYPGTENLILKNYKNWLSAVAQACNPSTLGGWDRWITRSRDQDHLGQHGETPSLLKKKIQKISWAWWRVPVIPATQEAEAWELLCPGRQRLQWAESTPLHSSLGNKMRLCLK